MINTSNFRIDYVAPDLADITDKVLNNHRLSFADGVRLYQTADILALGMLANYVNMTRNGTNVYFVQNQHINPTNICTFHCNFCSFRRDRYEPDAYAWTIEHILERATQTITERTREIHIVGGLHPDLTLDYYCNLLSTLKQTFPHAHLKAFTAVEVDYLARISRLSHRETLHRLIQAGLDIMPGGGAEIFHPRIRQRICPEKVDGTGWLAIHGLAHQLGIKSNATMLYGHIETVEDCVDHLIRLREQQDHTGGFLAFIPLAYHPTNNNLGRSHALDFTTGIEDIRHLAVSRLILDNFAHIKSYWIMSTPGLAQISLSFGVSDMDGTVIEERIYHDAGATTGQAMTCAELVQWIAAAGKTPVERDALYSEIKVYASDVSSELPTW